MKRKVKKKRTLVLNSDYTAHSVVTRHRAIRLMMENRDNPSKGAFVISFYPNEFVEDTRGRQHPVPSVMVLSQYIRRKKTVPFARKNVLMRDKFTCQYCGTRYKWNELTFDHVVPRCQYDQTINGTPTHWENIVTACKPCNTKKAGRTPKQAGMKLIRTPITPAGGTHIHGFSFYQENPEEWDMYLPELYKELMRKGV